MSKTIKVTLTMTINCDDCNFECLAIKGFKRIHPSIPPDLFHLDCILDEHIDGYVDGVGFGKLTDISFAPDTS